MRFYQLISTFVLLLTGWITQVVQAQYERIDFVSVGNTLVHEFARGEERDLHVTFLVRQGYHIQANEVLEDHLIPTTIAITSPESISVQTPIWPAPASFQLRNAGSSMLVFHDELLVKLHVKVLAQSPVGDKVIVGMLHYQACDSVKCYFPRDLQFTLQLKVH